MTGRKIERVYLAAFRKTERGPSQFTERPLRPPGGTSGGYYQPIDLARGCLDTPIRIGSGVEDNVWTIDGGPLLTRPAELWLLVLKPNDAIGEPQVWEALEGMDLAGDVLIARLTTREDITNPVVAVRAISPGETTSFVLGNDLEGREVKINVIC